MQTPFSPRLFVLSDHSVLTGQDEHIKSYVQTSVMIGRQIKIISEIMKNKKMLIPNIYIYIH